MYTYIYVDSVWFTLNPELDAAGMPASCTYLHGFVRRVKRPLFQKTPSSELEPFHHPPEFRSDHGLDSRAVPPRGPLLETSLHMQHMPKDD